MYVTCRHPQVSPWSISTGPALTAARHKRAGVGVCTCGTMLGFILFQIGGLQRGCGGSTAPGFPRPSVSYHLLPQCCRLQEIPEFLVLSFADQSVSLLNILLLICFAVIHKTMPGCHALNDSPGVSRGHLPALGTQVGITGQPLCSGMPWLPRGTV